MRALSCVMTEDEYRAMERREVERAVNVVEFRRMAGRWMNEEWGTVTLTGDFNYEGAAHD